MQCKDLLCTRYHGEYTNTEDFYALPYVASYDNDYTYVAMVTLTT